MFYFGDLFQFEPVLDTALYKSPDKAVLGRKRKRRRLETNCHAPAPTNNWSHLTDTIVLDEVQLRQDQAEVDFVSTPRSYADGNAQVKTTTSSAVAYWARRVAQRSRNPIGLTHCLWCKDTACTARSIAEGLVR
jgi:hypothetical protein